jgi:NAD(P)-dependent dehydrogenase (short-subunit alcohol dehydrogenase family)
MTDAPIAVPPRPATPADGLPTLDLRGRVIVVVGAGGGGIGTAISTAVARAGGRVVAVDVRPEALEAAEAAWAGTPGPHRAVVADARSDVEVETMFTAAAELGPLHGLVHVAGGMFPTQWEPLLSTEMAIWDAVVELNLRSTVLTTTAAARRLAAAGAGGSIVTTASVVGLSAMPFGAAYAASKAAIMSFARTAAIEWGPLGVRVNAVAPGTVRTPKSQAGTPPAPESDAERAAVPLGRRGRPEDIASATLFLLSDHAAWITGQVLVVDGGSSARPSFLDDHNLPVFVRDPEIRARLGAR